MSAPASFQYCSELPPDVPPGIRLDEWRRQHVRTHEAARRHRRTLHRHRPWCALAHPLGGRTRTSNNFI